MEQTTPQKKSEIFYGWWIVMACALIAFLSGASRFSFTMFFPTLIDDLGWTRATLGFALTIHMWTYAFCVVAAGLLTDRYGARLIMSLGGIIIIIGLALTSTLTRVWQLYLFYGVILAVGVSMTFAVPILGTVRKWFIKKAGAALALTHIGGGLGGVLMAVVIPDMIAAFGWRKSWLYLGMGMGVLIMLLAGIIIRKSPESMGLLPDGETDSADIAAMDVALAPDAEETEEIWTVGDAVRTRTFWCFLAGGAISTIPAIGITGHIVNWGMDVAKAAGIAGPQAMGYVKLTVIMSAVFTMAGAIVGGPLSDRFGRKLMICLGLAANTILFLFIPGIATLPLMVAAAAAMSFSGGVIGPVWGAYLGDIFGRHALATIFSLIVFSIGIVGGTGSFIFGWLYDIGGSYKWAWFLSSACTGITFFLYLFTRKEVKKERGQRLEGSTAGS
jgi:MFS family permease